jgi:predicted ATPase
MVGREPELRQLHERYVAALRGERQLIFITGESGIGKTTLVDAHVAQIATMTDVWLGHGQCIEHHGAGEAYLPLLEALAHLGRAPDDARLREILTRQAPSWLLQLPTLAPTAEDATLQRRASDTPRERMLRELAEAVEALTAERPLVLVLEDLHWSDSATLDWLAYVARRRQPARLLVLGTYRPVEALVRAHPVRTVAQELQVHGQCAELVLDYLSEAAVMAYLQQRFGSPSLPARVGQVLSQRTNGNPLFLVTLVDALVRQGELQEGTTGWELVKGLEGAAGQVPESLRQWIER